jgi:hypothetical protein
MQFSIHSMTFHIIGSLIFDCVYSYTHYNNNNYYAIIKFGITITIAIYDIV